MEEIRLVEIPLDFLDMCEVVSSSDEEDEETTILNDIHISTNADWSLPPLTEAEMNRLRNATADDDWITDDSDSDDDECSCCNCTDEMATDLVNVGSHYITMPYYLPLKTVSEYQRISEIEECNGKGYNRTFIG